MTNTRTARSGLRGGIALALLSGLILVPAAQAAQDETTLISRQSTVDGGVGADHSSFSSSASADGRFVAFESNANNLSTADNNRVRNVFLRDTQTNTTTLISRRTGPDGAAASRDSSAPSVSADGRFVAFESRGPNLSGADNDFVTNVFIRDTQANTTTLISRQSVVDGGAGADVHSHYPSVSADGRFVAFESNAYNLSTADADGIRDVFLRDTQSKTTTLISRVGGPTELGADDNSSASSISADGRFVAFQSNADNLSNADSNLTSNIFLRDTQSSTTTLVSRISGATGAGGDGASSAPSTSADGRFVAFESNANNLSNADNNRLVNVFRRNIQANTTTLINRPSGAGGAAAGGASSSPSIAADGRSIAFQSNANNLSAADDDAFANIFLRDTQSSTTTLVSRQSAADGGAGADGRSFSPSISADGRFVAFDSEALNLSTEDSDGAAGGESTAGIRDIFLRDVLGP